MFTQTSRAATVPWSARPNGRKLHGGRCAPLCVVQERTEERPFSCGGLRLVGCNAELVDLVLEDSPCRAEQLGGAGLVVVGVFETSQDQHALENISRLAEAPTTGAHLRDEPAERSVLRGRAQTVAHIGDVELGSIPRQNHRTLDGILELADVPRPTVP